MIEQCNLILISIIKSGLSGHHRQFSVIPRTRYGQKNGGIARSIDRALCAETPWRIYIYIYIYI